MTSKHSKKRVAIAGFQHETNTFSPIPATYQDFVRADSWPGMLRGAEIPSQTLGMNLPIAGMVSEAEKHTDVELVPLLWCAAEPSSQVADDAFDRITSEITQLITDAAPLDGICLDLHGAMVTESHDDGEGEFLAQLRTAIGNDMPISVSLDLHANISSRMVEKSSSVAIYRTYPHLDMADTGARAFANLIAHLDGWRPQKAFRQLPFLISLPAQNTGQEPARTMYETATITASQPGLEVDIAMGFTAADTVHTGPSILAYHENQAKADAAATDLYRRMTSSEMAFVRQFPDADEAVYLAMKTEIGKPVVIADVQDNPGAGATSDTTGLLKALVSHQAQNAVIGLVHDPETAEQAHNAGVGEVFTADLGGKHHIADQPSFSAEFKVKHLSSGNVTYTGKMYGGGVAVLGKSALLQVVADDSDVQVIVTSERSQCLDQALFAEFGVNLENCSIVVVKSTVHYRADFEPIAARVIEAATPGSFLCDMARTPYRNLRNGVRIEPGGKPFKRPGSGEDKSDRPAPLPDNT